MKSATQAVVDFVTGTELASMPDDVVREGKRCVMDGLGVMLAGSTEASSRTLQERLRRTGGREEATVLADPPVRAPAFLAAQANGTAGHAMDYDDTQLSNAPDRIFGLLTHPTIPPLAAVLALAEREGASGRAFLEAFLVGFEAECKIAEAIHPEHYRRGFHSSGTLGAFGAGLAAARLLGLKADAVARVVGIVAGLTGGIRVSFGTMMKPLHVGRAAENGVVAAELAAAGFTSGGDALDGPWGYFQVAGGGFDRERIVGALGSPWTIVDPGVSVKPYPSGSLGHPSMDALLKLVTEHDLPSDEIEAIELRAGNNILGPLRYPRADNALEAKFCIPFILSAIALRRRAGIREFTDEFVRSRPVQDMMDRVRVVHDAGIEALGFEKMRSRITVRTRDGRTLVEEASVYRGGPERPLTREELRGKFRECASLILPGPRIESAIRRIESLEALDSVEALVRDVAGVPVEPVEEEAAP